MKRRAVERSEPVASAPSSAAVPRAVFWIVMTFALLVPLVWVTPSEEAFRRPKDLLVRLEAIVLGATVAWAMILGRTHLDWRELVRRPATRLTAAVLAWTVLATLLSSNRAVSAGTLGHVVTMTVVFACTLLALRERRMALALVPVGPALVNTAVIVAQRLHVWSPVGTGRDSWQPTGLIGNTNDTGAWLMFVALAAVAAALASPRWRWTAGAAAAVLVVGMFLTTTLSAVIALGAGLIVLGALRSIRTVAAVVVICALLAGAGITFYPPLHERFDRAARALSAGDYDRLFSYRFVGYLTAWMIALDHPVTGLGPGTFGWAYFDYRQRAEERFPMLKRSQSRMFNFSEAHNDHLQVLAQTGIPGLLLFAATLLFLARQSFRATRDDDASRFVRYLSLPLAAAFAVLALAQFPLELTAPMHTVLYFVAASIAWGDR